MASPTANDKEEWKEKADSLSASDEKTAGDIEGASLDDDTQPMPVDKKIRRKVDLNLIPLIAILYLCSFLYVTVLSCCRTNTNACSSK